MITAEQALELLQAQVTKKGDGYVYKAEERAATGGTVHCYYYEEDKTPSCIVGHVFEDLGLEASRILDGYNNATVNSAMAHAFPELQVSPEAFEVLKTAQFIQDDGKSWGDALIAAKEKYSLLS